MIRLLPPDYEAGTRGAVVLAGRCPDQARYKIPVLS
jgi:hypothetical protein